ncbi:MAG: ribose-phosphate pyrophosphokinase-like domain-containing protein, partial [Pseudanabaena sp.]
MTHLTTTRHGLHRLPSLNSGEDRLRLFAGSANLPLAQEISRYLGIELGPMVRQNFAAGDVYVPVQ